MLRLHDTLTELTVVDGQVIDSDGRPFDRVSYSHFKYGWTPPARTYGAALASLIADQLWEVAGTRAIRIVSAPYKFLPTASHAIAQQLLRHLSHEAIQRDLEPPTLVPFHKARPGSSQYAKSSEAERLRTLATLGLRIDKALVPDSVVLVVDDIRITGSAEASTAKYLEPMDPHCVWYLHAARLSETAQANPGLEDELNQTVAHDYDVILEQVRKGEFQLNTRVLRHMLEWPANVFNCFLRRASSALLMQMYDAAVGTGKEYCQRHTASIQLLFYTLVQRDIAPTSDCTPHVLVSH